MVDIMQQIANEKAAMDNPEQVVAAAAEIKRTYRFKRTAADAEINSLPVKGEVAQIHVLTTKPQTAIVCILGSEPLVNNPETDEPWAGNHAFAYTRKVLGDARAEGKPL
jgi:hypothetical protein